MSESRQATQVTLLSQTGQGTAPHSARNACDGVFVMRENIYSKSTTFLIILRVYFVQCSGVNRVLRLRMRVSMVAPLFNTRISGAIILRAILKKVNRLWNDTGEYNLVRFLSFLNILSYKSVIRELFKVRSAIMVINIHI